MALTKRFGSPESGFWAVDHASFQAHRGEVFGFLGPNDADKTTIFRMLTGVIEPTTDGETTWIIDGYVAGRPTESGQCYRCERRFEAGALLYRPVFRRGAEAGAETFSQLPDRELWICAACVAE